MHVSVFPASQTMLQLSVEKPEKVAATAESPTAGEAAQQSRRAVPAKSRSIVMRWNGQWIGGDRFARDYAGGVIAFDSEVAQAVARRLPARYRPTAPALETHAAVWAAVLVAFEAAGFREPDREILQAALLGELRALWSQDEESGLTHEVAILERAAEYFALRDSGSRLKTAARIVDSYLVSVGLSAAASASALASHLREDFGYRILRDIYRLSAASRLRTAAVSLVERQKARVCA
jgi:hypothetical protein